MRHKTIRTALNIHGVRDSDQYGTFHDYFMDRQGKQTQSVDGEVELGKVTGRSDMTKSAPNMAYATGAPRSDLPTSAGGRMAHVFRREGLPNRSQRDRSL